jgi:hypothetical protein
MAEKFTDPDVALRYAIKSAIDDGVWPIQYEEEIDYGITILPPFYNPNIEDGDSEIRLQSVRQPNKVVVNGVIYTPD